jgi:hypothetical protein
MFTVGKKLFREEGEEFYIKEDTIKLKAQESIDNTCGNCYYAGYMNCRINAIRKVTGECSEHIKRNLIKYDKRIRPNRTNFVQIY